MPIQRLHGDVLCAATDGLILTIRWSPTRIGGQHRPRLCPALAGGFRRDRGADPLSSTAGSDLGHPPGPGPPVQGRLCRLEVPTDKQKAGIVTSALSEAMMTGGWRLPFDAALGAILNCLGSLARPDAPLTFVLRVLAEQERIAATEIAAWKGVPLP